MEGGTRGDHFYSLWLCSLSPRSEDTIRSPLQPGGAQCLPSCKACMCVSGLAKVVPYLGSGSQLIRPGLQLRVGPMDIFTALHFKLEPLELEYKSSKGEE